MKQTLPAKLMAQFEKLEKIYSDRTKATAGIIPDWLHKVLNFLEYYRNDSVITQRQLAANWHRQFDSASIGNWADQMIRANNEFRYETQLRPNTAPLDVKQ